MDKEAIASMQTAANHGDTTSLVILGTIYTFGDENIKRDTAKGAALLKQASDQGSTFAKLLMPLNSVIAGSEHFFGLR
jgi:TPR repeat protein